VSDQFANINFEDETVGPEPKRTSIEAPALDDLFASPSAAPEHEPEPSSVAPASDDDQIGRLQIALGDRDRRIATLNSEIDRMQSALLAAQTEAEAGRAARTKLDAPAIKKLFEIVAAGNFLLPVPRSLLASQRELEKAVAESVKIHAGASHQPLLQIVVRDISTMQPTPAAELPPKRRRKIFGIF
jgi:hypothetical protein